MNTSSPNSPVLDPVSSRPSYTLNHTLKYAGKKQRKILKLFLLAHLHKLFSELFLQEQDWNDNDTKECYAVDSKIIQLLIKGIVETGEYTLEGIAYYTGIPFDIIYDAACGINYSCFSITPWARVINLYMQVKPEIAEALVERLLEMKLHKGQMAFSSLLTEV